MTADSAVKAICLIPRRCIPQLLEQRCGGTKKERVVASAPGKITLYGEHAVVYGEPAIVTSIDRRVYATCTPRNDGKVRISALNLEVPGVVLTYSDEGEVILETDYGRVLSVVSYIREGIRIASDYIGERRGADITIESTMPVGAGLGTSAAVTVATIAAFCKAMGHELDRREIAELAWKTEKTVQGAASPMDSTISTFGGTIYIRYEGGHVETSNVRLKGRIPFVIGYVERKYKTKDMVRLVRDLKSRYPPIVDRLMKLIGEVVREAKLALEGGDYAKAGELMNINHGLLDALGVSTLKLNEMVYAARDMGALGAKLSGAGGGGSIIALVREEDVLRVTSAIEILGGRVINTKIGGEGLMYESE